MSYNTQICSLLPIKSKLSLSSTITSGNVQNVDFRLRFIFHIESRQLPATV